jgi:hypothetical protein
VWLDTEPDRRPLMHFIKQPGGRLAATALAMQGVCHEANRLMAACHCINSHLRMSSIHVAVHRRHGRRMSTLEPDEYASVCTARSRAMGQNIGRSPATGA